MAKQGLCGWRASYFCSGAAPALVIFGVLTTTASAQVAAQPGETGPAAIERSSGLQPDAGLAVAAPAPVDSPATTADADGGLPAPASPPAAVSVTPEREAPKEGSGGARIGDDDIYGRIGGSLRLSYQGASAFPGDDIGTTFKPAPFITRLRVAPEIHFKGFGFLAEADAASGVVFGDPPAQLIEDRRPRPLFKPLDLRQLYLEYKWSTGVFRVGQQTSNWGLGLLANAGAKDADAGDFGQQHFGNLTYRALLAGRPLFFMGGAARAFEVILAADLIVRDNFAEFDKGDRAFQGVLALRFNKDPENNIGVYAVYRNQRAVGVTDGARATDAIIIDLAGKWEFLKRSNRVLSLGFEAVTIQGTTTQGRNDNAPQLAVQQYGAAVKLAYRFGNTGLLLDWGYASGDQNPSDARIENFRMDRDFKVGLILFDEVIAWQSARSSARASDPNLLGVPPEGVELAPTGGSITSAWYLFPRVRYGICKGFDVYGGPLFAFSTARLTDPFLTRVNGGTSTNYLGGRPGQYLGTELDVGAKITWQPHDAIKLSATLEGGLLLPGDAFTLGVGGVMGPVVLGRVRLAANL